MPLSLLISNHESCSLVAVGEPDTDSDDVSDNEVQPIAACSGVDAAMCTFVEGSGTGSYGSVDAAMCTFVEGNGTGSYESAHDMITMTLMDMNCQ